MEEIEIKVDSDNGEIYILNSPLPSESEEDDYYCGGCDEFVSVELMTAESFALSLCVKCLNESQLNVGVKRKRRS